MTMDKQNTYPLRSASIVEQTMEKETVIVVPARGKAEVLNELGSFIWSQIDNSRSVQDIIQAVCAEYEVDEATASRDALLFLQNLENKGVIQLSARPA